MNLFFHDRKFFKGKRILVTGASGYLASSVIEKLKMAQCHLICLTSKEPRKNHNMIEYVVGNISERSTWELISEPADIIFHFAAQTSVAKANADPEWDYAQNVLPLVYLIEHFRRKDIMPTIIFASTVTVAGNPLSLPVSETHPDYPITIYDLHKKIAEEYLKYYVRIGAVQGCILRLPNVFGPGPESSSADRGILNQMIKKAMLGEQVTIYGAGDMIRDYLFIDDVASAFLRAAESIKKTNGEHFVLGTGKGLTISQAIQLAVSRIGRKTGIIAPIIHIDPPSPLSEIDRRNFIADYSRFAELTGWEPVTDFLSGIDCTLEAFSL